MRKILKNEIGITLIALVITIIVLLILAGVSIATLTGENGILTQAETAKEETEVASIEEKKNLAQTEARTYLENYTYTDNTTEIEKTAVIPAGFAVSPIEGEQSIDNGLVVIGEDGSEFVWVPVTNINSMAQCSKAGGTCNLEPDSNGHLSCTTHGSTEIVGKLYGTEIGENFGTINTNYYEDDGLREPAIITGVEGTNYYDGKYYSNAGYSSLNEMQESLKNEYKMMAESVAKYGGFYIGRYETSLSTATATEAGMSGKVQSKGGVIPTSASNPATNMWYGLYKSQKDYKVSKDSIQSSMIWGSQYDAMLNWVKNGKSTDKEKITMKNIGNTTSGKVETTGNQNYSDDSINNIRDLGGNLREWTLEAHLVFNRVVRGGNCFSKGDSPSYRGKNATYYAGDDYTSRLTIYIK